MVNGSIEMKGVLCGDVGFLESEMARPCTTALKEINKMTTKGEAEMDEQRVPNLEELDEQQAQHFLAELFSHLSAEEEYQIRHEDYTLEMPQSGERIRGREKMRAFQEAYPNPPSIEIRRVLVRDRLWVVEGVNDYGGGQMYDVVLIIELRDGKWWRDTRYYANPFEAPEGSSGWKLRLRANPNFREHSLSAPR